MIDAGAFGVSTMGTLVLVLMAVFVIYLKLVRKQRTNSEELGGNCVEQEEKNSGTTTPVSVNYHFTRKCNYQCGFCFHTAKTSFLLPIEEAKRGLRLLKAAGLSQYIPMR